MKFKVSVTKKHIRDGRKNFETAQCPLGLALQDAELPAGFRFGFTDVTVSQTAKLPQEAKSFLATLRKDVNAEVEPFTFELDFQG